MNIKKHISPVRNLLNRYFSNIPSLGALYFDIDKIADKSVDLPHMLPSTKQFEEQVSELGVTNNDQIILYDNSNQYFASARVWWTLRVRIVL